MEDGVADRDVERVQIHQLPSREFSIQEQLLRRNVKRFRGGLVFKAHRLLYHSTLGLRVIKKRREVADRDIERVQIHQLPEREFFIDNLLVRIHSIIVMIRWTGLAPWELEGVPWGGWGPSVLSGRGCRGSTARANLPTWGAVSERLVFHCRTTSASTAPCTSRRMCYLTHYASWVAVSDKPCDG